MSWGIWDKKMTADEMAHTIKLFCENGITTFDHADIYGDYTTEADFGHGFKKSGISRDKLQFVTKCGIKQSGGARQFPVKSYDYSAEYIIWSVENSLKNLQTDFVDVLLLHRPSPLMEAEEIASAISKLKTDGKILDFGLSNFTSSQTDLIRKVLEVDYNQIQFSASHFTPMLDGSLDYMQLHGIRPMAWNPLGTVFREDSLKTRGLKKVLSELNEKYHVGADTLLLAWILKHPSKTIPVAGTVNPSRIQQLPKALETKLSQDDWFAIWTESLGEPVP